MSSSFIFDSPPPADFQALPEVVRTLVEGERLTVGHLFHPAFATELAKIDPLPHQRLAVYEHLLPQSRLRFLLADDAGAGKTIMSGIYIREMLSRRLLSRVLIVPPAGLVGNWWQEMQKLFDLPFRILAGTNARGENPFVGSGSDLVIVSLDTLAGERMFARLQDQAVVPYDLVIFDEAHKLSANREADLSLRRTDRYKLAEALAGVEIDDARWMLGWHAQHLLLLTATPHMGKEYPYYCLWKLLEPEVLSTIDAFNAYPADARARHFLRRTKEEMVTFEGVQLYPPRISDTLSYELTRGEGSEQQLYDATTRYISTVYNQAQILNRTAAQLAMSVFQRRLASSTHALLRSFERRREKLLHLIEQMRNGRLSEVRLAQIQRNLERVKDALDVTTADEEESPVNGREGHEVSEEELLSSVVARSLADLEGELVEVEGLLRLARRVYDRSEEAKFEKLREVLRDPRFAVEKLLIFTEHRDTLEFLVKRLEGMGYTGAIAQIHGGMNYVEREREVLRFRRPLSEGGAQIFVATDAAAEGINLQVCWLMVNYDLPWNPARLEQRMGRIHRYGQQHTEVHIMNLVAGSTREGRVMKTLLEKLEKIRKELRSDKVFDVIGRLFEGVSLREYMEQALAGETAEGEILHRIEGTLTKEQVQALAERERRLYGDGGEVAAALPRLRSGLEREMYCCLLPGYTRRFVQQAAALLDIAITGDPADFCSFAPEQPGALDGLLPLLEAYPPDLRRRLTVRAPRSSEPAIFLHPGEPLFERLRALLNACYAAEALRGAVFIDPMASQPYWFHLAQIQVVRQADSLFPLFIHENMLEYRLIALRQGSSDGLLAECSLGQLMLLDACGPGDARAEALLADFPARRTEAATYVQDHLADALVAAHRERLQTSLPARVRFLRYGYDYQRAELNDRRARFQEKVNAGKPHDPGELARIRNRQQHLSQRLDLALRTLRRELELVQCGPVTFLAHALVLPAVVPRADAAYEVDVEAVAMRAARAWEEKRGSVVVDVSTAERAHAAGLGDWPGFDLLVHLSTGEQVGVEVKGRVDIGPVELTENEWVCACNLRERYWLYVVFECAKAAPRLCRVQDPFGSLVARPRQKVIIDEFQIFNSAKEDEEK